MKSVQNFNRLFLDLIERLPQQPFFIGSNRRLNVKQTYEFACDISARLHNFGLRPGDILAVSATRSMETALLFYATQLIGVIAFMLNPREIDGLCSLPRGCRTIAKPSEDPTIWTLKANGKEGELPFIKSEFKRPDIEVDPLADAFYIRTSGSEGAQKTVRHSQFDILNHLRRYFPASSCDEKDSLGVLVPFFHIFGLTMILMPIIACHAVFWPPSLAADDILDYFIANKITFLDSVPTHLYALAQRAAERGLSTPDIRAGLTAGAPMDKERFLFIEKTFGMKLLPVYGMSEIPTISSLGTEADTETRRTTVGKPLPGNEVKIVDDNGAALPEDEIGEICVRSDSLMQGYLGEPYSFDEEGFFHTGDLGRLDREGLLHIEGRKKLIIIRNGNNLSIADIENRLMALPLVRDCCVVGVPDDKQGEVPVAAIATECKADFLLRESIEANLPKNLWPTELVLFETLPTLPSGKVNRVELKRLLCSKARS